MVSGISQNFATQGMVGTASNPVYVQKAPAIAYAPSADTAEFTTKKKSGTKKAVVGTLATVAIAAATLFGLAKTGKLTKIENPSKWTEKLQNLAYTAGNKLVQGYDAAKTTISNKNLVENCKEKCSTVVDWFKGLFSKKNAETVADAAQNI